MFQGQKNLFPHILPWEIISPPPHPLQAYISTGIFPSNFLKSNFSHIGTLWSVHCNYTVSLMMSRVIWKKTAETSSLPLLIKMEKWNNRVHFFLPHAAIYHTDTNTTSTSTHYTVSRIIFFFWQKTFFLKNLKIHIYKILRKPSI